MPLAYGGGITRMEEVGELIAAGVEKLVFNSSAYNNPKLIEEGARSIGSQSIVVSIDVKKDLWGKYKVYAKNGSKNTGFDPATYALQMERFGAGEILLNSIERDGTFGGYDTELIRQVCSAVSIPVVAAGGAGKTDDFALAVKAGASAVSAGSLFVFQQPHRAVLISYPSQVELQQKLYSLL